MTSPSMLIQDDLTSPEQLPAPPSWPSPPKNFISTEDTKGNVLVNNNNNGEGKKASRRYCT